MKKYVFDYSYKNFGHSRNFFNKQNLRESLIKDFNLSNNQIEFKNDSVIIKNENEFIILDLLIDGDEFRIKRTQN